MDEQINLSQITPQQLQELIDSGQVTVISPDDDGEMDSELFNEAVSNMSPEEILDFLSEGLTQTDIVMESMNMVQNFSPGDAIMLAAIYRSRNTIEGCLAWLEKHFSLNETEDSEPEKTKKTTSPKSRTEGKRIVYGTGANLLPEDDSEQL